MSLLERIDVEAENIANLVAEGQRIHEAEMDLTRQRVACDKRLADARELMDELTSELVTEKINLG